MNDDALKQAVASLERSLIVVQWMNDCYERESRDLDRLRAYLYQDMPELRKDRPNEHKNK